MSLEYRMDPKIFQNGLALGGKRKLSFPTGGGTSLLFAISIPLPSARHFLIPHYVMCMNNHGGG